MSSPLRTALLRRCRGVILGVLVLGHPSQGQQISAGRVVIRYFQTVPSIDRVVAKKLPSDMHGMMGTACNVGDAPTLFNPEWFVFYAHPKVRPQPGSAAILAATDARNRSWQARIYRGVALGGGVFAGFAAGGLVEIGGNLGKFSVGAIPILGPFVKDGLVKSTKAEKPEGWVEFNSIPPYPLAPGDCTLGTFAVAHGGEAAFEVFVAEALISPAAIKENAVKLELAPAVPESRTNCSVIATIPPILSCPEPTAAIRTHPQVEDNPDDRTLAVARMIRERSAQIGAVE